MLRGARASFPYGPACRLEKQGEPQAAHPERGATYWSAENSSGEIDFLAQDQGGAIFAMEVKAEENLRAKSLRAFKQNYPQVKAVRFSFSLYCEQDKMRNVPLYAVANKALWG